MPEVTISGLLTGPMSKSLTKVKRSSRERKKKKMKNDLKIMVQEDQ